jgi:hypothetical protein
MQTTTENGEVLIAQIDEFDEVYGCVIDGQEDSLVRCWKCRIESCPMRGKKEVA